MTTMRAIVLDAPGPATALRIREVPKPEPRAGWVLLRVEAFGLNRSELHTRLGLAGPDVTFPRVLGIEAAGVVEVAPGTDLEVGSKAVAMMGGMGRSFDGGYADYTLVPAASVIPVETDLDWARLGALPEVLQTAWGSLTVGVGLQMGDSLVGSRTRPTSAPQGGAAGGSRTRRRIRLRPQPVLSRIGAKLREDGGCSELLVGLCCTIRLGQPLRQDPNQLRRRLRAHLGPRVRQVVLDGRVGQAQAVGRRLLRPRGEDRGDHDDLAVRRASRSPLSHASRLAAASHSSRPSIGISYVANARPTPVGRAMTASSGSVSANQ